MNAGRIIGTSVAAGPLAVVLVLAAGHGAGWLRRRLRRWWHHRWSFDVMLEAVLNPQRRWHLLLGLVVYPYLTVMLVYLLVTHSLHKLRGQCPACTPPIACTHPSTHDEGART